MKKICIQCGIEFIKKITCSKKDWDKRKFCSMKCKGDNQKGKIFFIPTTSHFKGKHHTIETRKKMSLLKFKNPTKFWTNKKINIETRNKISITKNKNPLLKEKSPNWKGGITILSDLIRTCKKYQKWRSQVFERDNWTCQTCQKRGCYLEVHHIKKFSDIIKEYNIKTIEEAIQYSELWNINNGVTLCKECHNLTKKISF